jgi:hypothetical protein
MYTRKMLILLKITLTLLMTYTGCKDSKTKDNLIKMNSIPLYA